MALMTPKHFIKTVLIDEVGQLVVTHPYLSFVLMGIGIEFLGKCIDTNENGWNTTGKSKVNFESAINDIPNLKRYCPLLVSHNFYASFRCGLAHAVAPNMQVTLSSKKEMSHLVVHGICVNLKAEDFYEDFKGACEHVISINFPNGNKMNGDFLYVPGSGFNAGTEIQNGVTSSMAL